MTVEATQSIQGQALEFPPASCSQPQTPPPPLTSNTQPRTPPSQVTSNTQSQTQTPPSQFTSNPQTQTSPPSLTSNSHPHTPPPLLTSNPHPHTPPPSLTSNPHPHTPPPSLTGNTQHETSQSLIASTTLLSLRTCTKKRTSYVIASPSGKVLMRYAYRVVIDDNNTKVCISSFVQTTFSKEGNTHKIHSPSAAPSP